MVDPRPAGKLAICRRAAWKYFDVSGLSSFALGAGQPRSNRTSTATLAGNLNLGSGQLALTYGAGTAALLITNGAMGTVTGYRISNYHYILQERPTWLRPRGLT